MAATCVQYTVWVRCVCAGVLAARQASRQTTSTQHYSLSSRMLVLDVRIYLKVKRLYRVAGEY